MASVRPETVAAAPAGVDEAGALPQKRKASPPPPSSTDEEQQQESTCRSGFSQEVSEDEQGEEGNSLPPKEALDSTLEEGRILFLFKPKVQCEHPTSLDEVQRFHILLEPDTLHPHAVALATGRTPADPPEAPAAVPPPVRARLITVGKKHLPDATRHDRYYGYVSGVGNNAQELTAGMGERHYDTKTKGERTQPAARVAGSGVYSLCTGVRGKSRKEVVLAYKLELPAQPGPCQQELGIGSEGALVLSIKNPELKREARQAGGEAISGAQPSAGPVPNYPPELAALFQGRRWLNALDPGLLDHEGTELLLIGARPHITSAGVHEAVAAQLDARRTAHMAEAAAHHLPKAPSGRRGVQGVAEAAGGAASQQGKEQGRVTAALAAELQHQLGPEPVVGEATVSGEWE